MKLLQALWNEPRAPLPPGPRWQDWLLVLVVVILAALEGYFREVVVWRGLAVGLMMALAFSLPWRRTHAAAMLFLVFGINAVPQITALLLGVPWTGLFTTVFLLLLPYSLLRWASGREAFAGLLFLLVSYVITIGLGGSPWREILAGGLFMLFPAALGASARYREAAGRRAREQVRMREREQLARELHDTVAHHVSAIAIQAQAGQALAKARADAPLEALAIIETAASKTLSEMRRIVHTMRDQSTSALTPAATIADIDSLADDPSCPLQVKVLRSGDLEQLDAATQATLYRLAQESVTNAVRHAAGAHAVSVCLTGGARHVRLTVRDDGGPVSGQTVEGFGLQGMAERVALLGGTFVAGPGEEHGWVVEVSLPRAGAMP